jgi:hypothetical protein
LRLAEQDELTRAAGNIAANFALAVGAAFLGIIAVRWLELRG